MAKSFKFKNNYYLDFVGINCNRTYHSTENIQLSEAFRFMTFHYDSVHRETHTDFNQYIFPRNILDFTKI